MKVGDYVHYIPWSGAKLGSYEFGRIKAINPNDLSKVFVVFNCGNDWDNYQDYTGQSTDIHNLYPGWTGIIKLPRMIVYFKKYDFHREDGPAVIFNSTITREYYYLDGSIINKEDWEKETLKRGLNELGIGDLV